MHTHEQPKSDSMANANMMGGNQQQGSGGICMPDNRPEAVYQRKLQAMANEAVKKHKPVQPPSDNNNNVVQRVLMFGEKRVEKFGDLSVEDQSRNTFEANKGELSLPDIMRRMTHSLAFDMTKPGFPPMLGDSTDVLGATQSSDSASAASGHKLSGKPNKHKEGKVVDLSTLTEEQPMPKPKVPNYPIVFVYTDGGRRHINKPNEDVSLDTGTIETAVRKSYRGNVSDGFEGRADLGLITGRDGQKKDCYVKYKIVLDSSGDTTWKVIIIHAGPAI